MGAPKDQGSTAGRVRRDGWLGAALFILALAALYAFIRNVLRLTDWPLDWRAYAVIAWVLGTIAQGFVAAGFVALSIALFGRRSGRTAPWRPGMLLIAAGYASFVLGESTGLWGTYTQSDDVAKVFHYPSFFTSMSLLILSELWIVAGALLLTRLLPGSAEGDPMVAAAQRSRRLGWVITGGAAIAWMSALYWVAALLGLRSHMVVSVNGTGSFGDVFKFAGYAIAAAAFIWAARWFQESGAAAYARRERLLIVAVIALLVPHVLDAPDLWTAVAWVVAALCAVIGFWISARSSRQDTGEMRGPRGLARWFAEVPDEQ